MRKRIHKILSKLLSHLPTRMELMYWEWRYPLQGKPEESTWHDT